jgi:hypothetical protein
MTELVPVSLGAIVAAIGGFGRSPTRKRSGINPNMGVY